MKKKIFINSLQVTEKIGWTIAEALKPQDVITLTGDLGVGKTELARAIIRGLIGKNETVPSPTFTLVQTYETTRGLLSHFDLYRLNSSDELEELGFDEILFSHMIIIEWPEKLGLKKLKNNLDIKITFKGSEKRAFIFSGSDRWHKFIQALSD